VATIEWVEPVDGHWWDPLRWRDSATGSPRVPTESDRVHIATFVGQSFSVFVDVRNHPLRPRNTRTERLGGGGEQPLETGQSVTVASLTVGSPDMDCCARSGRPGCWAALTLRGGTRVATINKAKG
jgi:hypothetical protein